MQMFERALAVNQVTEDYTAEENQREQFRGNTKKDSVAFLPELAEEPASRSESFEMNVADLLQYVNRLYPDILPEDVLRHFNSTKRPDGILGKSALYSKKVDVVYLTIFMLFIRNKYMIQLL